MTAPFVEIALVRRDTGASCDSAQTVAARDEILAFFAERLAS
jgi:hypothetical protein